MVDADAALEEEDVADGYKGAWSIDVLDARWVAEAVVGMA